MPNATLAALIGLLLIGLLLIGLTRRSIAGVTGCPPLSVWIYVFGAGSWCSASHSLRMAANRSGCSTCGRCPQSGRIETRP
jgi:hypothetical protein